MASSNRPPPATPGFTWALPDYVTQNNPQMTRPPPESEDVSPVRPFETTRAPVLAVANAKRDVGISPGAELGGVPSPPAYQTKTRATENLNVSQTRYPFSNINGNSSGPSGLRFRGLGSGGVDSKAPSTRPFPPKASLTDNSEFISFDSPIDKVKPSPIATTADDQKGIKRTVETNEATSALALVDNDLQRWVVAYGYATRQQYGEVCRKFGSIGRLLEMRGSCRPGQANWVAFQYESRLQAEKALCQDGNSLISVGDLSGSTSRPQHQLQHGSVFVGVLRMTPQLFQALQSEWDSASLNNGINIDIGNNQFLSSTTMQSRNLTGGNFMTEADILLTERDTLRREGGKKSVCQLIMDFIFGWN